MKLSTVLLTVCCLLALLIVGCADKPQEELTPTPGTAASAANSPDGTVPGQQDGKIQRFKRP